MLRPAAGVAFATARMPVGPLGRAVELFEAELIARALGEAGGSKPRTAVLDVSEDTPRVQAQ